MTSFRHENVRQTLINELGVMEDDIHVTSDEVLTFYLPINQFDRAKDVLNTEIEVLEEYEYEYLVQINL